MVHDGGGGGMNELIISTAQDYLTVKSGEDDYKRIVDIRSLLETHSKEEVTEFLKDLMRGKEKALRNLILINKTHRKVDYLAGAIFRIMMAIKVLGREEANIIEGAEQRTEKSRVIQKRDSGGNLRRRVRKNPDHDVQDRLSRHAL